MKSLKHIILILPEYLLIAAVLFYWTSAGHVINYIAIGLIIAIVLQMIFKNKVVGVSIALLLIMTSLYMILALTSEVREFPSFNSEAKTLLFVGLTYFLTTICMSVVMIYKYGVWSTK
ncbi:hypothetical protein [Psychroserpens mesophilus]|uniref:hypothetical protein n=1 Tax=Psychroserpens mesophilus TaxID=325473 RepID=UPI003D65A5C9